MMECLFKVEVPCGLGCGKAVPHDCEYLYIHENAGGDSPMCRDEEGEE